MGGIEKAAGEQSKEEGRGLAVEPSEVIFWAREQQRKGPKAGAGA